MAVCSYADHRHRHPRAKANRSPNEVPVATAHLLLEPRRPGAGSTTLSERRPMRSQTSSTTDPERTLRGLFAQLEALGHRVTLRPATALTHGHFPAGWTAF